MALFQPDKLAAVDPGYQHYRDSPYQGEVRDFVERMFAEAGHLIGDDNFEQMLQTGFHAAVWQLYVTWTFFKQGTVPPVRAKPHGPDLILEDGTIVEAIIATMGEEGPNRPASWTKAETTYKNELFTIQRQPPGMVYPDPKIVLRITGAVAEKRRQHARWIKDGIVTPDQRFVIAVNAGLVEEAHDPWGGSYAVRAAFGLGRDLIVVPVNISGGTAPESYNRIEHQPTVDKITKDKEEPEPIETDLFLSDKCSEVSGLLFSGHHIGNIAKMAAFGDLELVVNGYAASKLPTELLRDVRRTWAEVDPEKRQYTVETHPPRK